MKQAKLPLLVTSVGELEVTNAISLRVFRGEISPAASKAALALLRKDVEDGVLMVRALPAAAFERAKQLARKHTPRLGTRSLDILHVAAVLTLQAEALYTFDIRQAKLAAAESISLR